MHWKALAGTLLVTALGQAAVAQDHAATGDEWNVAKGFINSAFFSDACRRDALALDIPATTDARLLISSFVRHVAGATSDARAEWGSPWQFAEAGSKDCDLPAIALINLLRLDGVDADLVFVSSHTGMAVGAVPSAGKNGVVVYVPSLDRYVDPAVSVPGSGIAFDRTIRATTTRVHVAGPALPGSSAHGACRDFCVRTVTRNGNPDAIRVKIISVQ